MIGLVVTGVSSLLIGAVLFLLAVSYMKGKNTDLIAGWNDLPDDVKVHYGRDIARSNGKTLIYISLILAVYAMIAFAAAFEHVTDNVFLAATILLIIAVISVIVISIIKTSSLTKKQ